MTLEHFRDQGEAAAAAILLGGQAGEAAAAIVLLVAGAVKPFFVAGLPTDVAFVLPEDALQPLVGHLLFSVFVIWH